MPTYDELVFVANADQEDDDRIKRFMAALERGAEDLQRDPEAGLKGLLDANPDLDPELQRAVVDVTLPLFQPPRDKPYGWQDPKPSGTTSPAGCATTSCSRTWSTPRARSRTSTCRAKVPRRRGRRRAASGRVAQRGGSSRRSARRPAIT